MFPLFVTSKDIRTMTPDDADPSLYPSDWTSTVTSVPPYYYLTHAILLTVITPNYQTPFPTLWSTGKPLSETSWGPSDMPLQHQTTTHTSRPNITCQIRQSMILTGKWSSCLFENLPLLTVRAFTNSCTIGCHSKVQAIWHQTATVPHARTATTNLRLSGTSWNARTLNVLLDSNSSMQQWPSYMSRIK